MNIEEFIPKLNDIYTDKNGILHIDVNLPIETQKENCVIAQEFYTQRPLKERIKELYDLTDYEFDSGKLISGCYFLTTWKKKT